MLPGKQPLTVFSPCLPPSSSRCRSSAAIGAAGRRHRSSGGRTLPSPICCERPRGRTGSGATSPTASTASKPTAALLRAWASAPGLFDFLLIGPDGRHYWLELKRGQGPLSAAQEQFRQELVERAVVHGIARSFDDAVACLRDWSVLRPLKVQ